MVTLSLRLEPDVRARLASYGDVGRAWESELPARLERLCSAWRLTPGASLPGGTSSCVIEVTRTDGTPAVLKIALPDPTFGRQVATMVRGRGRGYALVLDHDPTERAVLMEALGSGANAAGAEQDEVERLLGTGARLLRVAWQRPEADAVPQRDEKAGSLKLLIHAAERSLGLGGDRAAVVRALDLLDHRAQSWAPERALVVHGDPHIGNMLPTRRARAGSVEGYVFVDPDGFVADPAYDAGVLIRDWCDLLGRAGSEGGDAPGLVERWAGLIAGETGLDEQAVWEWGFIERVTTGLHLLTLGIAERGRSYLETGRRLL